MPYKCLGRQDTWDYYRAAKYNERVDDTLYDWKVAGPNGAHFHLWVHPGTKVERMRILISKLHEKRDVVSWSYGIIPAGEEI